MGQAVELFTKDGKPVDITNPVPTSLTGSNFTAANGAAMPADVALLGARDATGGLVSRLHVAKGLESGQDGSAALLTALGGYDGSLHHVARMDSQKNLLVGLRSGSGVAPDIGGRDTDAKVAGTPGLDTNGMAYLYNPTANLWERQRNNTEGTLLASAARTAATFSTLQTNYNHRGVALFLDVTANPGGAETLYVELQMYDPLAAKYRALVAFPVTLAATNASYGYIVYPGISETIGTGNLDVQSLPVPRSYRVAVVPSAAGSWTYSLAGMPIL